MANFEAPPAAPLLGAVMFNYEHAGRPAAKLVCLLLRQEEPRLYLDIRTNELHLSRGLWEGRHCETWNCCGNNNEIVSISLLLPIFRYGKHKLFGGGREDSRSLRISQRSPILPSPSFFLSVELGNLELAINWRSIKHLLNTHQNSTEHLSNICRVEPGHLKLAGPRCIWNLGYLFMHLPSFWLLVHASWKLVHAFCLIWPGQVYMKLAGPKWIWQMTRQQQF